MAGFQGTSTRRDPHEAQAGAVEAERRDMMTMIPGEVVAYDSATQTATIRPRLKQNFAGTVLQAPDLIEVPVAHPQAGGFIIHKPLKAGDEVLLHFAQRSLDQSGDDASAADGAPGRMHDLSDAIAHPASYSKPAQRAGLPSDRMHIGSTDGTAGLQMKPDGTFDTVKGGDSVFKIIVDALTALKAHKNGGVAMDAGDQSALQAIIDRANAMKAT
jgi:hypothetical protein